jgi:hypothetical protein
MPEYLVFPIPIGLKKVKATNANTARNKYIKASEETIEEALIIIPTRFGSVIKKEPRTKSLDTIDIPSIG